MFKEKFPFARHAQRVMLQMHELKGLELPPAITWTIDWRLVEAMAIAGRGKQTLTRQHPFFSALGSRNDDPAVYHFSILPQQRKAIFAAFVNAKEISAGLRIDHGLKHPDYRNVSHVPTMYVESGCLYVGSVKDKLSIRLQQHLGITGSGRTGALYLRQLLPRLSIIPAITVTVYLFEQRFTPLRKHIEYVLQSELRPMLGKRSITDLEE